MAASRRTIAGLALVPLLLGGVACSGDDDAKTTPSTTAATAGAAEAPGGIPSAPPLPPGLDMAKLTETITKQLEQATTGPDGAPKPADPQEVDRLLKQQIEQYIAQMQQASQGKKN